MTDHVMTRSEDNLPQNDAPRRVAFLLVPGFALMSYASAIEPLRAANRLAGRQLYAWSHVAVDEAPVEASNGLAIIPDFRVGRGEARLAQGDTLLVCAGGNPALFRDPRTLAWLRDLSRRGVAVGGVSGGTYILARAGVLSGYRCTIHWEHVPAFVEEFPHLDLHRTLFEIDRDRLTCAGGVAALDMMHAVIERDFGNEIAAAVSDWFLQAETRLGSGPQRMGLAERHGVSSPRLVKALAAMESRIEEPASRAEIATIAGVSARQLERLFAEQMGTTLGAHYLALRLSRARALLRETTMTVTEVAVAAGFVSTSHFSRAFRARYGHPPRAARQTARAAAAPPP